MKYYSEKLNKFFDTSDACQKAEFEAKEAENREKIRKERELAAKKERETKLAAERKTRAEEVEKAREEMVRARSEYAKLLESFTKDYGAFHLSLTGEDAKRMIPTMFDIFNLF